MTFCQTVKPWLACSGLKQTMRIFVAVSPFETMRVQNNLDHIKPLCLFPILTSWFCVLFLLCAIHIHSITAPAALPPLYVP